jgi:hypothetical protein
MARTTQTLDEFMAGLDHPLAEGVALLRAAILASDKQITEQVKWKAPSFCWDGVDRVTFRLQPHDRLELIFHRGVAVRDDVDSFRFADPTGLLTWITPDRAVLALADVADARAKCDQIVVLAGRWMRA